jgi:hypothetical protein
MAQLATAKRLGGKSYVRQLREILWCKGHVRNFGVSDYFNHRLFDTNRDLPSMASVAGWRMEDWLDDQLNPPRWRGLAEDKLTAYAMLDAAGVPYPKILALFHPQGRLYRGAPTFTSAAAMAAHLRDGISYPCFVKPIFGAVGGGAASLIGFDRASDSVRQGNGETVQVDALCKRLENPKPGVVVSAGHLFQELVQQPDELHRICGRTVSTVRAVVVVENAGPVLHRTIWRIAVGANMTDNFSKGRSGNMLAAVDPGSGKVMRVVQGRGLEQRLVDKHPDTGASFAGFALPYWDQVREVCLRAARAFPMLQFQHWDVAFTRTGPQLLELNTTGSIDILQYASGQGLYDGALRRLIEEEDGRGENGRD